MTQLTTSPSGEDSSLNSSSTDESNSKLTLKKSLNQFKDVRRILKHQFNFVNIGYLSITHLLACLWFIPALYAPNGILKVMMIYFVCHIALALSSTTAYAHRLISHGATRQVNILVHLLFGYVGQTLAVQGSLASWAGKHRVHHAVDGNERHDEDPYSAVWFKSTWRNFLWSHVLCYCFESPHEAGVYQTRTEGVIRQHGMMKWQHQYYIVFMILFTKFMPFLIGYIIGGSIWSGLCVLWTSLLAIVLSQHITWTVNSVTHMWGISAARSSAKNNYIWLLPLGEGNHHADHHDAPTDYRNGFGVVAWFLDPTRYIILALRLVRLVGPLQQASRVTEVKLIVERRLQKLNVKKNKLIERLQTKSNQAQTVVSPLSQASFEMMELAKERATKLWAESERSLLQMKADIIERAQNLERIKTLYKQTSKQASKKGNEHIQATLNELKCQLKLARKDFRIEWTRFKLELKSAQSLLSYHRF